MTSFLHQSAFWPFKVVQGHPRSMILVAIESAYATSYQSVIVTMVLSCTVSEIGYGDLLAKNCIFSFCSTKYAKIVSARIRWHGLGNDRKYLAN